MLNYEQKLLILSLYEEITEVPAGCKICTSRKGNRKGTFSVNPFYYLCLAGVVVTFLSLTQKFAV